MTDLDFDAAIKLHLGLPALPEAIDKDIFCNKCTVHTPAGPQGAPIGPIGVHVFGCAYRRSIDHSLQEAVSGSVRELLARSFNGTNLQVAPGEPLMSNYYVPKENVAAEHRADVALIRSDTKQPIALIDIKTVTLTHQTPTRQGQDPARLRGRPPLQ
jgi:hypothetical protein